MTRGSLWVVAALLTPIVELAPQSGSRSDTVGQRWAYDALDGNYVVEVVATGLRVPFGLSFLPDGRAIVSDRGDGRLLLVDPRDGRVTPIDNSPDTRDSVVHAARALAGVTGLDAGLLDVLVHPDFARNGWIYYAFSEGSDTGTTTVVERARLRGNRLEEKQRLFAAYPAVGSLHHLGARLLIQSGYLYIALGDRDIRQLAQELWTDHGKIIRLHDDGRIPVDNPFVGRPGARGGIWSYGHRNPHGLAIHPETGALWSTEHGPLGGDEINIIQRGGNYGWPVVSHGREYEGHAIEGADTARAGMISPVRTWASSAALSGMLFYTGSALSQWRGQLFLGAMAPRYLAKVTLDATRTRLERLLLRQRWRVRVIQQDPDGYIYLGIDRSSATATDGMIVRIR